MSRLYTSSRLLRLRFSYSAAVFLIAITLNQTALGNPTGASVVSGAATIQNAPGSVIINQASSGAIINWQSFSINSGETTRFLQPGTQSAALNRVLGGSSSILNGSLFSNGQIYLINQNGILVGPGGVVNTVGGFTASTRDISNEDFLNGKDSFVGHGKAGVKNLGEITSLLGNVVLIGKTVGNSGQITAKRGAAELIAGDDVLLGQQDGIGNTIRVNPSPLAKADSKKIGVNNTGQISAAEAQLKAANGNVYALAINNGGVIRSTLVNRQGGHIWLTSDSGTIVNSGILNASATKPGGAGGSVVLKNAGTVSESGSIISKGGTGGTGGDVDISGEKLNFTGSVNLTAQGGKTGNLLIDPATLNVVTGGTGTVVSGQNDSTSTTISPTTVDTALNAANLTLNANTSITISNALSWTSGNTLTLSTNTAGSTISINASITGSSGGLTINTAGASDVITPNNNFATITVGSFILQNGFWRQNAGGGPMAGFTATSNFSLQNSSEFLRFQNGNGTSGNPYLVNDIYGLQGIGSPNNALLGTNTTPLYYTQTTNISGSTASWNSGAGFAPIGTMSNSFYGTFNGNGCTISGLTINQPSGTNIGIFGVVGSPVNGPVYTATIENLGLTGTNIQGSYNVGGLVGSGAITLMNCYTSGTVTGNNASEVGGLVGYTLAGSSITNCYNTGSVTGSNPNSLGGIVGLNFGTISNSYNGSNIVTTGTYASEIGGLVGENDGTITQCYSIGNINGNNDVGGLVGNTSTSITQSYATGNVSGGSAIGGLVGQTSGGTIANCYATGSVSATAGLGGGLVGDNEQGAYVETSYSSGAVGGGGGQLGGLIGEDTGGGTIQDCYFSTNGSGQTAGIGSMSGTTITYNGTSAPNVMGYTSTQLAVQSNFDSAWNFTLGSGSWGINGYSSSGQINAGRPFLQSQFSGVASVVPNYQITTYNRTNIGTGFSTTAYTFTGTVPQMSTPVLTVSGSNMNVGTSNNITIGSVSPSPGYAIEVPPVIETETFIPKAITVSAGTTSSVVYGNAPAFSNNGQSQVISGDTLGGTVSYSTTDAVSPAGYLNAGTFSYNPSISGYNSNYSITGYNPAAFTITPKPITVSANSVATVTYGNNPAFSNDQGGSGVFSGDMLGGTVSYNTTAGISPAGYINAGTSSYTPQISGANPNYSVSYNSASFTINSLPIVVSGNSTSATYGTPPPFTNNGQAQVFSGDTLGGTVTNMTTDGTSPAGYLNAGTYSFTPSISGYNSNYTISSYSSAPLIISPKAITVSGTSISSTTYGSNPSFQNDGSSQVLSGDTLGGTVTYSNTGTVSPAGYINVGTFSYTPSITGYNSNYTITAYNPAAFSVVPLGITVSANSGITGTYGTNPAFSNNGETQVLSGDTLGGTSSYSNTDALSPAAYPNAGTYTYTPSITGYNSNYVISNYNSAAFTINPQPITVSARPISATYGTTPPFSDNGNSQILPGDTLGGLISYSNTDMLSSAGYLNAGTYTYTPTITGANSNYSVTGVSARLTINPAALTISINPGQSVAYGTDTVRGNGSFIYTVSGLLAGDSSPVSLGGYTFGQTVSGGPYAITASTTASSNYSVVLNGANFNVIPKPITVSAIDLTTTPLSYGSTVPFSNDGAAGQLVGTDVLGGVTTYSTSDALSPAGYLSAGTYTYLPSIANANSNYTIGFKAASFVINPKAITVMANQGQSIVYGTDTAMGNGSLTYTAAGLLSGDLLGGVLGGYSSSQNVAGGPYPITQGTLGNPNYSISTFVPSTFQVNPATLSYVADPATGIFGLPFPQFTGMVTGFVNGDTQSNSTAGNLMFQTTATSTSPQGLYAVNGSGLTADNYIFIQDPGNAKAFVLTEPATIVTFETSSSSPSGSFSNQNGTGGDITDSDVFGGDYLQGTRGGRDRNSTSQSITGQANSSGEAVISDVVVDQSGNPAKGFSIRGGFSGFDRGSSSVPFLVSERLQRALSRDVRDILANSNKSRPAGPGHQTVQTVIEDTIVDQNGKPAKGFSIRGGFSGFDRGSLTNVPFLVTERLQKALSGDIRDILADSNKSQPSDQSQSAEPKTDINVKLEVITDKNGKATKDFFVLPGGAFGMGSKDLPPLIQQRILNQLNDDVRSVLSNAH